MNVIIAFAKTKDKPDEKYLEELKAHLANYPGIESVALSWGTVDSLRDQDQFARHVRDRAVDLARNQWAPKKTPEPSRTVPG